MNHISQLIDYQVKVSIETFPTLPILRFEGGGGRGVEHASTLCRNCLFFLKLPSPASRTYFENTHINHSVIVFYSNQRSAPGLVVKVHGVRFVLVKPDFTLNVRVISQVRIRACDNLIVVEIV